MSLFPVTASASARAYSSARTRTLPVRVRAAAKAKAASKASASVHRVRAVTASAAARAGSGATAGAMRHVAVTAGSAATAGSSAAGRANRTFYVTASSTASASSSDGATRKGGGPVSASSPARALSAATVAPASRTRRPTASGTARASSSASASASSKVRPAHSLAKAGSAASARKQKKVTASSQAQAGSSTHPSRVRFVTASSLASAHASAGVRTRVRFVTAHSLAHAATSLGSKVTGTTAGALAHAYAGCSATVHIDMPSSSGLDSLVMSGLSGAHPFTSAETPNGDVILMNGVGPALRWNPWAGVVREAGLAGPETPVTLTGSGVGTLTGVRVAHVRWVDGDGRVSPIGPPSHLIPLGRDGLVDAVRVVDGQAVVFSKDHGFAAGTRDTLVISGVQGMPVLNGTHSCQFLDPDHFGVYGTFGAQNLWTEGGSWTWGVAAVVYSDVPPPPPVAARVQILRNLEGTLDCLYVDVDSTDLAAASFASSRPDDELAARERVPVSDADGYPVAARDQPPPRHKGSVLAHMGRLYAAADVPYDEGCVRLQPGSPLARGVGTAWKRSWAGRVLCPDVPRCRPLSILAVDEATQTATLDGPLPAHTPPFAAYTVRPPEAERKLVYYSEAGDYESWPPWNAFALPDDGDYVTGLFNQGTELYVCESSYVYRVVFSSGTPSSSGTAFLAASRGCVNARCAVKAGEDTYLLDERGVSLFTDSGAESVSDAIRNVFRDDPDAPFLVDWEADRRLWHGYFDADFDVLRYFVHTQGNPRLTDALCYGTRSKAWWLERYPWPVGANAPSRVDGRQRAVGGTERRQLCALSAGNTDGAPAAALLLTAGTVSDDGLTVTLSQADADLPATLAGMPVTVARGGGLGSAAGTVSHSDARTFTLVNPVPGLGAGSLVQFGGVGWHWTGPWLRLSEDQEGNPRDVEMVFKPLSPAASDFVLRTYFDRRTAPSTLAVSSASDGIRTTKGSPDVVVSLPARVSRPGFAVHRIEGHQDYYAGGQLHVAVKLLGSQGVEPHRLYGLKVSGAAEKDGR